jgi:hypothetical protein
MIEKHLPELFAQRHLRQSFSEPWLVRFGMSLLIHEVSARLTREKKKAQQNKNFFHLRSSMVSFLKSLWWRF